MSTTLTNAQLSALWTVQSKEVVAVWQGDWDYGTLGWKPWFSLCGGVQPRTLHVLWLARLIRLDRKSGVYELASSIYGHKPLYVGRARVTPAGFRVIQPGREDA